MNYDMKTLARDFWYGKPHQERRLGDLYIDKTGLYKHREWRGFKDTMYYFYNIWMYNYAHMVMDVVRYGGLINFAKGVWPLPLGRPDLPAGSPLVRPRHGRYARRGAESLCMALPRHGQRDHLPVPAHVLLRRQPARRQAKLQMAPQRCPQRDRLGRRVLSLARQTDECPDGDDPVLRHLPRQQPYRSQLY